MSKEFKVGLIAVVAGVLLYYGFNFLKGEDFFSSTNKFYAIYDKVDGLNKSNPVLVNGLQVGRVSRVKLMQDEDNQVLVELDIDEDVLLGDSTVATLSNTDFLGSKGIVLTLGPLDNLLEPGDTVISYVDRGISQILEEAQPVANNLNTTITRINEILIGLKGSGEKVNEALSEVQKTSVSVNQIIAENQVEVAQITAQTALLISKLNDRIDQMGPIFEKTNGVLDSLNNIDVNSTLAEVQSTVENLNNTITQFRESQGTLGKLINDDSLYNNISQTIANLDKLIVHIDRYPKHFFAPLGKKHKEVMEDLKQDEARTN